MNIAFVTPRLFDQPGSGGEICSARLLAALAAGGHGLHCLGRGAAAAPALSLGPVVRPFDELSPWRRAGSLLAALASGQASTVQRLDAGGAGRAARAGLARGAGADVLVVDHLQAWAWLEPHQARLPAPLLVMHNLEAEGYAERAAQIAGGAGARLRRAVLEREARLLRRLEERALRAAAVVACLSEEDAQQLRRQAAACGARAPVEVLPGYPLQAPAAPRPPPCHGRRIGMMGTWTWGPNRSSLDWVLQQVLPLLPPDCRLVLAGAGLEGLRLPPRVQALGRVARAQDFYDAVDVLAIASLGGSGVQEKSIEALATGLPVVATAHALRGLAPGLPPQLQVADGPARFAQLCQQATAPDAPVVQQWIAGRRRAYRDALGRCLEIAAARHGRPAADPRPAGSACGA
ncbi:conserved hypothetical protein [Rubrivivax sp. A210]|uniref:glycosyltransferase n=1 Tax=Rubrivivax sp. A210 TaxID=2772301 RepID=UPI00191AA033|nr:glycosyltransferase [Rubrivivax sp. A210]CAD5371281.1 conserved hypothetical protein [Rubrivivax sp. A210]